MNRVMSLVRFQLKLLLRNKGFLVFLVLIPALSVFLLNIKYSLLSETDVQEYSVTELSDSKTQLAYSAEHDKFSIKVLDFSDSEITDHLLNSLSQYDLFQIYRYKTDQMTDTQIEQIKTFTVEHDSVGCILLFRPDFEQNMINGEINESLTLYDTSDDTRLPAFETALQTQLDGISNYAAMTGNQKERLLRTLEQVSAQIPTLKTVTLSANSDTTLNNAKEHYLMRFKFSLAVISFSFIFCGIMISSSIIKEKDNNVLTKIMISRASLSQYLLSKLIVAILCIIIQTFFIGISLKFFIHIDDFMNIWSCLYLIFGLGLIFSAMTLCTGILCSNTMSVNYICISIWCISCLIGGLYFPLDDAGTWFQALTKLMPQHWTAKCMELLLVGNHNGYWLYLLIIGAYIILLGTIALLATHFAKTDRAMN